MKQRAVHVGKSLQCFFIILITLLTLFCCWALDPTGLNNIAYLRNFTVGDANGTMDNRSRGYIYEVILNETAQTNKWKAYVGNVSGDYGLQDGNGYAIFKWDIANFTGEVYATKEAPSGIGVYGGGVPEWGNITCANSSMILAEQGYFGHNASSSDRYTNTFMNGSEFNLTDFYVAGNLINDTTMVQGTAADNDCFGLNLWSNNTEQKTLWEEAVLTDGTYEDEGGAGNQSDLIYMAKVYGDEWGFNYNLYDFQLLLPERGEDGVTTPVAYYFYVELI